MNRTQKPGKNNASQTRPKSTPSIAFTLKLAIFVTGCAGIVAEFVLSTLATYLVGNAVFQWTIVMSLMLFAMGVGSRISRIFRRNLLDAFIGTEFALSVLCAISAVLCYGLAAFIEYTNLLIYFLAFCIGTLIGFEIPLVIRINRSYENLRLNISGVMEKDYYGALLGGLLFAFVALPFLGLTYTPILLGAINFTVASLVLWRLFSLISRKRLMLSSFAIVFILLAVITFGAKPVILHGEQYKYRDKIIYSEQTPYQKIVMTRWRSFYWLYLNGQEQFSTFDEEKYHEPLVHPAMLLSADPSHVLVIGGGDGLAVREILKHKQVESITLVDIDPAMTDLAKTHPVLLSINRGAMNTPKLKIVHQDAAQFVDQDEMLYGVIIADLPDPDSVDLMHVYSRRFYRTLQRHLIRGGVFVTQATSPYFSPKAFQCLIKTVRAASFSVVPYHNQVPTMGEWGWIFAMRTNDGTEQIIKSRMQTIDFGEIPTRFINREAMISMSHFGKGIIEDAFFPEITVNTDVSPVLYQYYLSGNWEMY